MMLFQPVKFKRTKKSPWECGIKQISSDGVVITDYNLNRIENPYKVEADCFSKA